MPDRTASFSASPVLGIGLMLLATLFMSVNNAILKWMTADYPAGEILFIRGVFLFLPIAYFVWRAGGTKSLRMNSVRGHGLRALLVVGSAFCYVNGLRYVPLADATAISFAGPLFVAMLAIPILGEVVGWRRWTAIIVGFIGVIIIIRPSGDVMRYAVLLPLASTFFAAFRDVLTRRMTARETSNSILMSTSVVIAVAGLCTFPWGWSVPLASDVAIMSVAGILNGFGHYCMIESFRAAEAGLVSPFKYSGMLWAVGLGYLLWAELPDKWVATGSLIVIASGLYILHRELSLRRARQLP
ncbi:MAG: drug/metabolite transporter (DMT)-like permease [Alphaproteobacteria bacterium]|jgi:drug/metabolite transporter (DMT)-like permease